MIHPRLENVGRTLFLSSLVGVVSGLGAIAFQILCHLAQRLFLEGLVGYRPAGPAGEPLLFPGPIGMFRPWMLALVPAAGGLIAGLLITRFAPEAGGHGTDEAVDSFHRRGGVIRGRVPIVKAIASAITLGSGGSGGREGPIAQIGAGFGAFLATRLRLSQRERRILLAAGVGAGVGSIFRAPLAGALFAAEVLYSDAEFESDVIIPAAISTIVAYCVFSVKFGFGPLFATPHFTFRSAWELLPYSLLAIVVAVAARMFVKVFYGVHGFFQRLHMPPALRPMLGGLATGVLGLALYVAVGDRRVLDVLSFGYGSIQGALLGTMSIPLLLAIAGGKVFTTSLSIGSGGSGGVFGPSMVIGGALGGIVGLLAQHWMPAVVTQPGAYVAVGMAGFFAAAANTPISTLVMVSEMTGNYQLLLPALWVCALAFLIGRHSTLYRSQVPSRVDSPAHRGAMMGGILRGLRVRDAIKGRPLRSVPESAGLPEIIRLFLHTSQQFIPVLSPDQSLAGLISVDQIRDFLEQRGDSLPMIAHDLMSPAIATLSLGDDLDVALQQLVAHDVEELPVTEGVERSRLVGLLSRRDILAAYNQRRFEGAAEAATAS
ncbi:MAG: chloride channel protein [Candidatus Eiseniibacteriota bacterium]